MAPEYALWGYLTYKADVYSFGVLALEIFSGKNNNNYMPSDNCVCLLDRVLYDFVSLFDWYLLNPEATINFYNMVIE